MVDWSMAAPMASRLVIDALARAFARRLLGKGLLAHPDWGCQFASCHYPQSRADASIFESGEAYYNLKRLHSYLGHHSFAD